MLHELLAAIEEEDIRSRESGDACEDSSQGLSRKRHRCSEELTAFVECFKQGKDKVPRPVARLAELAEANPDHVWVSRNAENHLELAYERSELIRRLAESDDAHQMAVAKKRVVNLERGLKMMSPKLKVLETTHGRRDVKRLGFASPELVFGTQREANK